ncbi:MULTISPECIES: hypothetical protein [unclassified Streptomyces]|uniref:hypothetical protein n=1 Tax=unclassified Streptomyces TaxID=2593676 RepID=UPI00131A2391|nr:MULTISPECIES: hypothetical protein [unclassified Streptomyces]MYX37145.1 hypothetical protein [Streptomyces sp. SID8377]
MAAVFVTLLCVDHWQALDLMLFHQLQCLPGRRRLHRRYELKVEHFLVTVNRRVREPAPHR